METKRFDGLIKVVDEDMRIVTGLAAITGNLDFGYDIIHKGAFVKTIKEHKDKVRHLWMHDSYQPPTATILDLKEVDYADLPDQVKEKYPSANGGLEVSRKYLDTPRGNEIFAGLVAKPPAIREMSIGFDLVKWDYEEMGDESEYPGAYVRHIRELRLWDTSDVTWGMNEATVASKCLPFNDTGIVKNMNTKWEKPKLSDFTDEPDFEKLHHSEKMRIAAHFAVSLSTPPRKFSDLLLPHHEPSKQGVGPVIFAGLSEAMSNIVDVANRPGQNEDAVYSHLEKHYEQFEEEVPDINHIRLAYSIGKVLPDFEEQEEMYKQLMVLDSMLRAEPRSKALAEENALTQAKRNHEYQIRRRKLALLNM